MSYQVGSLINPRQDDPEYENLAEARAEARRISELGDSRITGVWTGQNDGSVLIAIYYRGTRHVPC